MSNTPLRRPGRSEAESRNLDARTPPLPREAPDTKSGATSWGSQGDERRGEPQSET